MQRNQESSWYKLQGDSSLSGIAIVACTGPAGVTQIMCTQCGHVFVDGKPFTDESDPIDSWELARGVYFHLCDIRPGIERKAHSRGRIPK